MHILQTCHGSDRRSSRSGAPVPVDAADFVVSSTYKWLLGTHGLGILYWNRTRQPEIEPAAIGWYSVTDLFAPDRYEQYTLRPDAGRFELGYNNFPAIYVLARSVPYLHTIGLPRIAAHARALGGLLIAGLQRLHLEVITPEDPTRRGASISFLHPDAAAIGRALAQQQIHVWAGDGRVRASTHLFNDEADVGVYLAALAHILDNHPSGAEARRAPDPTHAGKRA
jgi:selenocysteine lyase/cysteine desulfurase